MSPKKSCLHSLASIPKCWLKSTKSRRARGLQQPRPGLSGRFSSCNPSSKRRSHPYSSITSLVFIAELLLRRVRPYWMPGIKISGEAGNQSCRPQAEIFWDFIFQIQSSDIDINLLVVQIPCPIKHRLQHHSEFVSDLLESPFYAHSSSCTDSYAAVDRQACYKSSRCQPLLGIRLSSIPCSSVVGILPSSANIT